jgi:zona occludens toxin
MILGIEGIPGSGKSYEAVAFHVLAALKAGRKVITNLPLNLEALSAIDPAYPDLVDLKASPSPVLGKWDASDIAHHPAFQPFEDGHVDKQPESVFTFGTVWDYYDDWRAEDGRGPLYVIDECHVSLPKFGCSSEVVEWFKLHRHYNVDVVLLTQNFRDINQPIAQLLATLIKCRKADILGQANYYIRKVHAGYRGAVIQTDKRKYKAQYFGLYKSHTQGMSLEESKAQDVSPFIVKFNRFKWAFLAFAACFVVWAFWPKAGTGFFGQRVPQHLAQRAGSSSNIVKTSQVHPMPPAQPASVASAPVVPASAPVAESKDFGPLADKLISIQGMLSGKKASLVVFAVSDENRQLYMVTSDELQRAGYTFHLFGYCFGWLQYGKLRKPVQCDAPVMDVGSQDRPIVMDRATGAWSNGTGRTPQTSQNGL